MKLMLGGTAAAALLALTSATGFAQQSAQPATPGARAVQEPAVMVTLATTQKKGPTGQAILSQHGNDVMVTLKLEPSHEVSDASIVRGTCPQEAGTTQASGMSNETNNSTNGMTNASHNTMSLTAVTNGLSQTTVPGMTVQQLTTGGYAIIVRQKPWLCGDLSKANPVPGTQ